MKLLAVENHPAQAAIKMIHVFCDEVNIGSGDGGLTTRSSAGQSFSVPLLSGRVEAVRETAMVIMCIVSKVQPIMDVVLPINHEKVPDCLAENGTQTTEMQ